MGGIGARWLGGGLVQGGGGGGGWGQQGRARRRWGDRAPSWSTLLPWPPLVEGGGRELSWGAPGGPREHRDTYRLMFDTPNWLRMG